MLLLLALLAAQPQPPIAVTTSPPPVVAAPMPPPPPVIRAIAPPIYPSMKIVEPQTVDVMVTAPGEILFKGPLRTSTLNPARINQSRSEIAASPCPETNAYLNTETRSFRLTLGILSTTATPGMFNISVEWGRPVKSAQCGQGGNRSVSLTQTVELVKGKAVVLEGDAGLKVILTRR